MPSSPFSFVLYLLKVINGNTETLCEICSKLTIKTLARRHWCWTVVFIAIFEQISHIFLMVSLLTLNKWMVAWLRQHFPPFSSCSFKILESTEGENQLKTEEGITVGYRTKHSTFVRNRIYSCLYVRFTVAHELFPTVKYMR